MASKQAAAKRRGSLFETSVLKWLRDHGILAERLAKAGKDDEGDIVAFVAGKPYVFELKATARLDLPAYWREAETEAANYAKARNLAKPPISYVIVKRRNAGIEKSWVIQPLDKWIEQFDAN